MSESRLRCTRNIFISSILLGELFLRAYARMACGVIAFYSPEWVSFVMASPWKCSTTARQQSSPAQSYRSSFSVTALVNTIRGDLIIQAAPIRSRSGVHAYRTTCFDPFPHIVYLPCVHKTVSSILLRDNEKRPAQLQHQSAVDRTTCFDPFPHILYLPCVHRRVSAILLRDNEKRSAQLQHQFAVESSDRGAIAMKRLSSKAFPAVTASITAASMREIPGP
jgi:hypothetical protein